MAAVEQDSMFRMIGTPADEDVSSREGSVRSQQDSDRVRPLQRAQHVKLNMTILKRDRLVVAVWLNAVRRTVTLRTT